MEAEKPQPMDERQRGLFDSCVLFAYRQAHSFYYRHHLGKRLGDVHDVEQEAMIGLAIATRLWNPNHPSGAAFITYVGYAIRSRLLKAAQKGGLVAMPTKTTPESSGPSASAMNVFQLKVADENGEPLVILTSTEPGVDEQVLQWEEKNNLRRALDCLRGRNRQIMEMRIRGYTLQRIAGHFDISKERVRQLEKQAVARLRQIMVKGKVA